VIHNSFQNWVIAEVLPLKKRNPSWCRLDGEMTGSNRNVVARFKHLDRVWGVHGDTRIDLILRAYDAVVSGKVQDPFVVQRTAKNVRDCLDLTPQLKLPRQPKHFYVYE
jgi:hypothetical protein